MGMSDTPATPAFTVPENATLFAVITIGELVVLMEVPPPLLTLPVPLVVIVTPVGPVTLPLRLILSVAVRLIEPLVETRGAKLVIVAEAPVVVTEKLPPIVDPARVKAPELVKKAAPVVDAAICAVEVRSWFASVPKEPDVEVNVEAPVIPMVEIRPAV